MFAAQLRRIALMALCGAVVFHTPGCKKFVHTSAPISRAVINSKFSVGMSEAEVIKAFGEPGVKDSENYMYFFSSESEESESVIGFTVDLSKGKTVSWEFLHRSQ